MTEQKVEVEVLIRSADRIDGKLMLRLNQRFIKCPFRNEEPCSTECALYREVLTTRFDQEDGEDDRYDATLKAFCGNNGVMCTIVSSI